MKLNKVFSMAMAMFMLSSCATIFSGSSKTIMINTSNGEDVEAEVSSLTSGTQKVTLPAPVVVKTGNNPVIVKVKDSCYKETETVIPQKTNLWVIGDFLFGIYGTTGTTVDLSSGAWWTYDTYANVRVKEKTSCKR